MVLLDTVRGIQESLKRVEIILSVIQYWKVLIFYFLDFVSLNSSVIEKTW